MQLVWIGNTTANRNKNRFGYLGYADAVVRKPFTLVLPKWILEPTILRMFQPG